MATHPQSKKFGSLSDKEKQRRITSAEKSGKMTGTQAAKARQFWDLATPPPSRRATVFAAEQQLAPWEVRPPPKAAPQVFPIKPTPMQQRAATRKVEQARFSAAKKSVLDPKARQFLASTLTPERREGLQRADVLPPVPRSTSLLPTRGEVTKLRSWNPITGLKGAGDYIGRQAQVEVDQMAADLGPIAKGIYEWTFSPEERADNAQLLKESTEGANSAAEKTANFVNSKLARDSNALEQMGIPIPEGLKKGVKASVLSASQAAIGIGPGVVVGVAHPHTALTEMTKQYQDYYGRLLRGDFSVLEEQGVTQGLMDALGLGGAVAGGAMRLGALSRTSRFLGEGGEIYLSSEATEPMSAAAARNRAVTLGQEPVQLPGGKTTMGVPTPVREVMREATLPKGKAIEDGNKVIIRNRGGDESVVIASEENGLVGKPAPDVNNTFRHEVAGERVDVLTAYEDVAFAQRMVPRSALGRGISDVYWRWRGGTGTASREGVDLRGSGAGARSRLLRQEREVAQDRGMGDIRAFRANHKAIQKDVVLSTAYDRLLRYPDAVQGITEEIAARKQRGFVETGQEKKLIASLEQALEVLKDPPQQLMDAAWAGKMLADDTTQFLIRRGMLSPEVAERSEFAAQRWLKPGHIRDEPLDSPRRSEVEDVIREQFPEGADLAMAHTDTLARAWGEANGRDPADWYETFIKSVESQPGEEIAQTAAHNPQMLRQYRRVPNIGETLALADPEQPNVIRVARVVEIVGEEATVEWVREPNAGTRFKVPKEEVMGNTSKIHGWRSGIALEAEKLGAKVSKQEAHSRLSKAPGVKADEWKWMGMDKILDDLYEGVKSRSRDEIVEAIRARTFRFETTKLTESGETYFESQYDVTLPGDYVDYSETLIHWPERLHPMGDETPDEPDWYDIQESWGEHLEEIKRETLARGEEWDPDDYHSDAPDWYVQSEVEHFREAYQPPEALYEAPHFTEDQSPDRYSDQEDPGLNKNLLGWVRYSTRWVGGRLTRVIEEAQSDWHQKSKGRYRTEEAVEAYKEAQRVAEDYHAKWSAKKQIYHGAFRKAVEEDNVRVRVISTGEEGYVRKGTWGEMPRYMVHTTAEDDPAMRHSIDQAFRRRDEASQALADARERHNNPDTLAPFGSQEDSLRAVRLATASFQDLDEAWNAAKANGKTELGRSSDDDLETIENHDLMDKLSEMREARGQYEDKNQIASNLALDARATPDAPYKGSAWEELLFREAVREAVSNGETHIAWTTGAQQAQRYNALMASNVDRVEWNGYDLRVRDGRGDWHSFEADTESKLVDYVGSAMAKKLAEQLAEKTPEVDPNLVRIERPHPFGRGNGATTSIENASLSDVEPGDIVYVGYPSEELSNSHWQWQQVSGETGRSTRHALHVRDDHGYTTLFEYDHSGEFPVTGHGEHMNIIEAKEKILDYQQRQLEAGLRPGRGPDDSAVLEGEDISIGGGGFIDAYDRRMRNYAKKWFGKYGGGEPQQIPVDSLSYDTIWASDTRHPGHEQAYAEMQRLLQERNYADDADVRALSARASASLAPIHRVKAGETILAESESLQAALRAAKSGGSDAGIWPPRIRQDEGDESWRIWDRGGQRGGTAPTYERARADAFDTYQEAVVKLEGDRGSYYSDWDSTFDHGGTTSNEPNPGPVWAVEIPESLAAELHTKGTPLFQRRRGQVYGLAHLTDEGAEIYLNADAADIATWVEESAHAVIPDWFDAADARGDTRGDHIRAYVELEPGAPIDNLANERIVRAFQAWLHQGAIGAPQQRQLLHGLSEEMKEAYYSRSAISPTDSGAAEIKRMLNDSAVTSFFRDAFDVAPYKDLDPGTVAFSTMKLRTKVRRTTGDRMNAGVQSILPPRRSLTKQRNTMKAWESGNFDVGPDVTAHYAAAEWRLRTQDELAKRLKRYDEPIEVRDGIPILKPGYRVYNYHGLRGAQSKLDTHFRASDRYGDIPLSESDEPLLSADPAAGGMDVEPEDFLTLAEETAATVLGEEMLFDNISAASVRIDNFMEKVQQGNVTQIPEDAAQAFERASGASFSKGAISHMTRSVAAVLAVPTMLARWRMIGKFAYPILNAVQTGVLIGINQGPAMAFSVKAAFDLTPGTRFRLMSDVGLGTADIATHTPEVFGLMEKARRAEQSAFRYMMTALSQPEARVRLLQMVNDLRRAGYRGEKDVVALLDSVKAGDAQATKVLNQISRQAEDAVVRFRGLSPEEQFIVRDMIFVYGWLRAATRFTIQFPLNRPVTASALYNVGQFGWQQIQDDFWPLAREQAGMLPLGQKKRLDGFSRKIVDVNNLLPFSSAKTTLDPILALMGLEEGGLRPAVIADMLAPSVEWALSGVYGKDPRYGSSPWDVIKEEFDPHNLPGVMWAMRLIDPASTGTKLKEPLDRAGIAINLFAGMMAPQEIRESVSYARWLDQQPQTLRTVIREQNNAVTFAQLAQAANEADGEPGDVESVRAINSATAYKVYADLFEHKRGSITPLQRAAIKAKTLKRYYPDAYADGAAEDFDLGSDEGKADFQVTWDDLWEETVGNVNNETRAHIKDVLGKTVPTSEKEPHSMQEIMGQWLQTAPPESLARLRAKITPNTSDQHARELVLQEMQR